MRLGRRRERGGALTLYYASDVHGSELCYRKFLGARSFYGADALIMGGDLTGKLIVPLVAAGDGSHTALLQGAPRTVTDEELPELERQVRFNGFYPYRCTTAEYERLESDEAHRGSVFTALMVEQVQRWVGLADEQFAATGQRCWIMPGNDDELAIDAALDSAGVVNPDGRVVDVEGIQLLSCSWVNPTPWDSPREEAEELLLERLERLAEQLDPDAPAIFNLHCPPYGTTLDLAPRLNGALEVEMHGSEMVYASCGSRAVRTVIERHQPMLALHGHIHESRASERIGRTLCVNPGSKYAEGTIDGAVVRIRDGEVDSCQLVSG